MFDEGCSIKALALTPSLELYHVDMIIESSIRLGFLLVAPFVFY